MSLSITFSVTLDASQIAAIVSAMDAISDSHQQILSTLGGIVATQEKMMASLDDVLAKVAQETTDIGSLKVFIQGLKDQISAIPGLTAAQQAQIDTIMANVTSNDQAVVDAMAASVPPTATS